MTSLDVALPKRPAKFSNSTRLVYRVVLDSGQMMTLPELAQQLKIPYAALATAVHAELSIVGRHEDGFLKLLSRVRAEEKRKAEKRARRTCPHCLGSGMIDVEPGRRAIRNCTQCGCQHKSNPEFDTCSTCRGEAQEAIS